jgi:Holliday junction resolvasome RuvABC DNA-binding subunit
MKIATIAGAFALALVTATACMAPGLMQSSANDSAKEAPSDLKEEALEVLTQLQYKKEEAKEMIRKAFAQQA